jgi:hypothetical protein
MKFLCVPCDRPMTLRSSRSPEKGSLSVVYACPDCGYEMAMLTNPFETQLVQSLGVRIGPSQAGKCPFPDLVAAQAEEAAPSEEGAIRWTEGARERLARIPEFVRPMATLGIEKFARAQGRAEVDEAVLDEARDFFGM